MAAVVEVEHVESQDCEFISEKNVRGPKKRFVCIRSRDYTNSQHSNTGNVIHQPF